MQDKERVAAINAAFPGYDKYLHSKVLRPEKYGIRLTQDAQRILDKANGRAAVKRPSARSANREIRITARISREKLAQLQRAAKAFGASTIQETLERAVDEMLKGAPHAAD